MQLGYKRHRFRGQDFFASLGDRRVDFDAAAL
jgi:hypothetical protein